MSVLIGFGTSVLALVASTASLSANSLVSNNASAGLQTFPAIPTPGPAGGSGDRGATIPRLRLISNDASSTGWPQKAVQVDLWSVAPTFANGFGGAYVPSTGAGAHLGTYSGTFSSSMADGYYAELTPSSAQQAANFYDLSNTPNIFWSLSAISSTGVLGASKTMTLIAEYKDG